MSRQPIVDIADVTFTYAGADAPSVQNLNLQASSGQVIVLAGPSGCGKTTLTRALSGLIPSFFDGQLSGRVTLDGLDVLTAQTWDVARLAGTVFQNPRTQFFTTDVVSELAFGCENIGLPPEETRRRVDEAIAQYGLASLVDRSVFALSGGEKQRLACAAVATMQTPVLVLDEPSANLDASGVARLYDAIADWKQAGRTVVVAEHRLYYLRDLADEVIVMESGRIVHHLSGKAFRALSRAEVTSRGLRAIHLDAEDVPLEPSPNRVVDATGLRLSNVSVRRHRPAIPGRPPNRHPVETLRIGEVAFPAGAVTAVIGPNGAGKSTLANFLIGLGPRQRGCMTLDGQSLSWRQRRSVCYLVQQDVSHQLFTESAQREVRLACPATDKHPDQTTDDALVAMNLAGFADRHPLSLSAGQRQRLSIACALASGRRVAIFDEPTSGLDLIQMRAVADALRGLAAQGRVVIVITHDAELISEAADHVVELADGHVTGAYPLDQAGWAGVLKHLR